MTFQGAGNADAGFIGPSDFHIDGLLLTQGGSLTINDVQGVDVASGMVVSTRHISDLDVVNHNFATGASVGSSGTINIQVANTDILNPILYINFTDPHIEIGSGASILANATTGYTAGDVTLDATNINYSLTTELFTLLSAMDRNASITMDPNSTVEGDNVTFNAHAGDFNPLDDLDLTLFGSSLGEQYRDFLGANTDQVMGLLNPLTLKIPLSVIYKNATAKVDIGSSTTIQASGAVDLESDAETNAGATAGYTYNTSVQASLALAIAESDAETTVDSGATINGAQGVTVQSTGNTEAVPTAKSATTSTTDPPADTVQIAAAFGVTKITSHATVAQGATISSSGGNVSVAANGQNITSTTVETRTDAKGTSGFTLSVNDTNTDILAEVDGTITAHGAPVGSPATIDPFTQVDWGGTNSIITLPAASGYSTGEEIEYDSGSGGAMPGLVSGSDYYIINVPGHPTQIQLASTYQNALNGVPIVFGSFPYLTAVIGDEAVHVPIVNIDGANTAIDFGYNPGFTSGQTVTYNAAPNQGVNGLTDGDTYTIAPLAGHSGEYQLLDTSNKVIPIAVDSTFGAIPYLTTTIDGVSVNLPITQVDDGLNAIVYASSIPGVSAGQSVVYHAAQGQAIAGLVDGTTYTMQETSTKGEYQLLDADNNPALIYADPAFTGLQQNLAATLDSSAHTVAFGFNTGFTNDSRLVYEGATDSNNANVAISGLTVGQVYWVLPVTSDSTGESFQLSATQGGSPIALSAERYVDQLQFQSHCQHRRRQQHRRCRLQHRPDQLCPLGHSAHLPGGPRFFVQRFAAGTDVLRHRRSQPLHSEHSVFGLHSRGRRDALHGGTNLLQRRVCPSVARQ